MSELPPCIRDAVAARDVDALDDLLSFFRTFGDEKLEPVLWSLGYFTFDTYEQRKRGIRAMLNTAPLFPCPFGGKPERLKKYCTEERRAKCPYANPSEAFRRMIEGARLEKGLLPVSRYLVVEFHFATLRLGPFTYNPANPATFFVVAARYLLEELRARGINLAVSEREVAGYLLYYIYKDFLAEERARELGVEWEIREPMELRKGERIIAAFRTGLRNVGIALGLVDKEWWESEYKKWLLDKIRPFEGQFNKIIYRTAYWGGRSRLYLIYDYNLEVGHRRDD